MKDEVANNDAYVVRVMGSMEKMLELICSIDEVWFDRRWRWIGVMVSVGGLGAEVGGRVWLLEFMAAENGGKKVGRCGCLWLCVGNGRRCPGCNLIVCMDEDACNDIETADDDR